MVTRSDWRGWNGEGVLRGTKGLREDSGGGGGIGGWRGGGGGVIICVFGQRLKRLLETIFKKNKIKINKKGGGGRKKGKRKTGHLEY